MASAEFTINPDPLRQNIKLMGINAVKVAGAVLYREAEKIKTISREKYCPYRTGTLRGSARVTQPAYEGYAVSVDITYGGPAAPYAIYVHEMNKNYTVGQWKYLETPLKENLPNVATAISRTFSDSSWWHRTDLLSGSF